MADKLERVRKALRELSKALRSLHGDPAPNTVHKLRTASRRLESIAIVLETVDRKRTRRLVKSIEPLRKAAGGVRDMDVLLNHAHKLVRNGAGESFTRLVAQLEIAREQYAGELQHAVHHHRKAALEDLKAYSGLVQSALKRERSQRAKSIARSGDDRNQMQETIHTATTNVVRELGEWKPLDVSTLHEFRLRVKHLRYTLQLDAQADPGLVETLGRVQRSIGDWHDWQQLKEIACEVLAPEKDQALLDRIDATLKRRLHSALAAANALRGRYLNIPPAMGV